MHGTKSALEKFGKKYPKYTFIRTSVNNWKKKFEKEKKNMIMPLSTEFLVKVKDVVEFV